MANRFARRRRGKARTILFAASLAFGTPVHGATESALDETLRAEALAIDQQVAVAEPPHAEAVTLFTGTRVPELRPRHVWVRVDGGTLYHHEYNDREGRALAAGGMDRLAAFPLSEGEHRLRVELIARHVDDKPGQQRVRQRLELTLVKPPGPYRAAIEITKLGFTGNAEIALHDWSGAPVQADDDPDVRAIAWLAASGRPLAARFALGRLQAQAPGFGVPALAAAALAAGDTADAGPLDAFNAAAAALASPSHDAAALAGFLASPSCQAPDVDLCDRARLLLGYDFLRRRDGAAAAAAFRAVRVPGPYASGALLGLGWAVLAPAQPRPAEATAVPVSYTADVGALRRSRLPLPPAGEERRKALLAALVPWSDLVGRDPLDAASQEGALAIAWALDALGAHEQSVARYRGAVDQLESARAQIDAAMAQAADGRLAARLVAGTGDVEDGWDRTLAPSVNSDETRTLRYLMTDDSTSAAIAGLREIHELSAILEADAPRAAAASSDLAGRLEAARSRVTVAEAAQRSIVASAARAELTALRTQTERTLAEARFALARVYDRPELPGEREVK